MPSNTNLQKQIAQKVGLCLLLGAMVWTILLIVGASQARTALDTGPYNISLGPLVLNHITRTAVTGGQSVTFSFEPGLLWYFLSWAATGIALGYIGTKHNASKGDIVN